MARDQGKPSLKEGVEQARLAQEVEDLQAVMSTRAGRRLVWRILSEAGVFRMTFNTNFGVASFGEGRRSLGNQLFAEVHEHCFVDYQQMEREARDEQATLQNIEEHEDN